MAKTSLAGKFAEVSDPTVGVDFFARLVQVRCCYQCLLFVTGGVVIGKDPARTHLLTSVERKVEKVKIGQRKRVNVRGKCRKRNCRREMESKRGNGKGKNVREE